MKKHDDGYLAHYGVKGQKWGKITWLDKLSSEASKEIKALANSYMSKYEAYKQLKAQSVLGNASKEQVEQARNSARSAAINYKFALAKQNKAKELSDQTVSTDSEKEARIEAMRAASKAKNDAAKAERKAAQAAKDAEAAAERQKAEEEKAAKEQAKQEKAAASSGRSSSGSGGGGSSRTSSGSSTRSNDSTPSVLENNGSSNSSSKNTTSSGSGGGGSSRTSRGSFTSSNDSTPSVLENNGRSNSGSKNTTSSGSGGGGGSRTSNGSSTRSNAFTPVEYKLDINRILRIRSLLESRRTKQNNVAGRASESSIGDNVAGKASERSIKNERLSSLNKRASVSKKFSLKAGASSNAAKESTNKLRSGVLKSKLKTADVTEKAKTFESWKISKNGHKK